MKVKSLLFALVTFLLLSSWINASEDLIFAVTYIRHGDRAPYAQIDSPNFKYQWPGGIGELTPEGMNQEYLLGKELRVRYIDTLHLLPAVYKNNAIYVLSTDSNRTIMSAESLLMGLYPPGTGPKMGNGSAALPDDFQPVPIRVVQGKQKNILRPEQQNPERFKYLMDNVSHTQQAWTEENIKHAGDFKRWSVIIGKPIKTFDDFLIFADTVRCMSLHGIPIPEGLNKDEVSKILSAADYLTALQYVPHEVAYFMASGFLSQLNTDFQLAADGKQPYKYILYSGHDTTICGIMSALGKPLQINPPYASHVDFELYKNGSDYFVKVRYNGETVKLSDKDILILSGFNKTLDPYLAKN